MPTYEYLCEKCEHEFEREQRMSDPPVKTCPACRSRKVTRLISRTSFVLKGGGWYSDLYSSSDSKSKDAKSQDAKGGDTKDKPTPGAESSSSAPSSGADAKSNGKSEKPDKSKGGKAGKASGSKSAA
jgi:putative FmdB family regulatory protein